MPQNLEAIVQKMIDAGEPEEAIASVIQSYSNKIPPPSSAPDTFAKGVLESITSGEAARAGLQGGLGWLKGATLDIPQSIAGGLKSVGNMITNAGNNPLVNPIGAIGNLASMGKSMLNTTQQAGGNPEEFGRMMGQLTGQPLTTMGITKAAPPAARITGPGIEKIGKVISKEGLSSGLLPPIFTPHYLKFGERLIGKGIEKVGKGLQSFGTPLREGQVVSEVPRGGKGFKEGEILPEKELPSGPERIFYGNESNPIPITDKSRLLPESTESPIVKSDGPYRFGGKTEYTVHTRADGSTFATSKRPPSEPTIELIDDTSPVNASGESSASAEALSRQNSMRGKGQQYVVYDRAGNERPLIGPDAVDYVPKKGETYGIKGPEGFQTLTDNGGKVPTESGFKPGFFDRLNKPASVRTVTYVVNKSKVTPDFIKTAKKKGYQFAGLNDEGNWRFRLIK